MLQKLFLMSAATIVPPFIARGSTEEFSDNGYSQRQDKRRGLLAAHGAEKPRVTREQNCIEGKQQ